ncbi:glycosyltransferase family 2 protein [Vibrio sp. DNB22_12_1]|uniref:glycosyltransferase family 2 protein n=1 Tax=unclassified Vibrio TaxID=2614977 RepID=UPI00406A11C1
MLISIIIPTCLRSENELIRSIDSALWNGYENIEIVVVNDNRTTTFNDFPKLIERYKTSPIQFVYNIEKQGAASARNYGVSRANGELITFLDDDDFILPGRLKQMYSAFVKYEPKGVNLVSTGRIYQYDEYSMLHVVRRQLFGLITLKDIYIHNDIDIGFMIRKSLFLELNGFDESYHNLEDWDFIIRALKGSNAYKLKSFSYVIKNDTSESRVSNNDYLGLKQIQSKFGEIFGTQWLYKIDVQIKRAKNELSVFNTIVNIGRCRGFYPVKQYLGSLKDAYSSK